MAIPSILCWTLLHSLWQGLIAAFLAAFIMIGTKHSSPAFRYHLFTEDDEPCGNDQGGIAGEEPGDGRCQGLAFGDGDRGGILGYPQLAGDPNFGLHYYSATRSLGLGIMRVNKPISP